MAAENGVSEAHFPNNANGTSTTNDNSTSDSTNGTASPPLPILIAGGGCVGLFLALLLAQSPGPAHIIILDSSPPDQASTRAMAHQPPTYPLLSRIPGLLPELIALGSLSSGLCFRTSVANGSQLIAGKTFDNSGEGLKGKGQLLLPQGKFQDVLVRRLLAVGSGVDVRLGSCVTGFTQRDGRVDVFVQDVSTGSTKTVEAAYLIGADGAHSVVRKALGVPFEGETLDAQLVATDLHYDFHAQGFYDANFIIDDRDYGLIGRITQAEGGKPALWRVSYGVPLGLSEEYIKQNVDEKLRGMLPNGGLDEQGGKAYEVVRIAPYKAQQRCVSTFVQGNVCLIGDAAHLTNPYAGLGLASGIADASSLAEVLLRILGGKAQDKNKLLSSWSTARRQNFSTVVEKPSRIAYARVRSDVSTAEKREGLMAKDPMVAALKKGMPVMPPSLETSGEELERW